MFASAIRRCWILAGVVFLTALGDGAHASTKVYAQALRGTGWVIVPGKDHVAAATCWVADAAKKWVITSHHVVAECDEAIVYFPVRSAKKIVAEPDHYLQKIAAIRGRVVAKDNQRDLALIQLESLPGGTAALAMADDSCQPGEVVHSVGNSGLSGQPWDAGLWRYTHGYVRQVHLRKTDFHGKALIRVVETQSPINPGDSGGPLVNDRAEVVGVTMSYNKKEQLVSYHLDVSEVKAFLSKAAADLAGYVGPMEPPRSLVGHWKLSITGKQENSNGECLFNKDGSFVLYEFDEHHQKQKSLAGRFAYANDILFLISLDGEIRMALEWSSRNEFSSKVGPAKMGFARQLP